jgi:integrase
MTSSASKSRQFQALKRRAQSEIREWQAKYINYVRLTGEPTTARRYEVALENVMSHFKNKYRPADFLRRDVEDYKIMRLNDGASNSTINIELSAARSFWEFIQKMSDVPVLNPFKSSKSLKTKDPQPRAMALADVNKIMAAAAKSAESQDRLLALLAFTSGMRGDEMFRIEKSHFDFPNKRIVLPPEIVKGKKKGRIVPLRDDLAALVQALPEGKLFAGWADSKRMVDYRWRRLCWKAEVPATGLHATRHTFGTMMSRAGADIATIRDMLGHADIKTTGIYLAGQTADSAAQYLTGIPTL